jgi:hypothetical protein
VIVPNIEQPQKIRIRRLYCARKKQTVSLLPDFCLPHRVHGPAVLGVFLMALALQGLGLLPAIRRACRSCFSISEAQSLHHGFQSRAAKIRGHLSRLRRRLLEPAPETPEHRRSLGTLVINLIGGSTDPEAAFVHHARIFHERYGLGLA